MCSQTVTQSKLFHVVGEMTPMKELPLCGAKWTKKGMYPGGQIGRTKTGDVGVYRLLKGFQRNYGKELFFGNALGTRQLDTPGNLSQTIEYGMAKVWLRCP